MIHFFEYSICRCHLTVHFKIWTFLLFKVIVQTEDIIRCRIQQRNITTVIEKLQLCLPGKLNLSIM